MGSYDSHSTLLTILDQIARKEPDRLYCIHPKSSDISQGWKEISFGDVLNASNRMAHWIQENVGSSDHPEVLAYSAANDIRYVAFVLACMRLGHIGLLLSSRNSSRASEHLMTATGCSKLLYTRERERQVSGIVENGNRVEIFEIPPLWDIYSSDTTDAFMQEGFGDPDDRVAIYIHTSGTTGMPKLVPLKHSYFHTLQNICNAPVPQNRKSSMFAVALPRVLAFSPNPFFHIMGIFYIAAPMLFSTSYVVSPERPLSAELLSQILDETHPRVAAMAPSVLEDLSSSDLGMECIGRFDWITYGGAPMDPEIGNRISKIVHLQAVMGASECSFIASLKHQDSRDWQYHEWNPCIKYEMREVADGLFELVIRGGEHRVNQAIFRIFPGRDEYCTGDLFSPHPKKAGLWCFACRADDIVVLSNGEKFNPSEMEAMICSHSRVSRAIVFGQGQFQSAAIIEPRWELWKNDPEALIDEIWPLVKLANELAPGYAKLARNRVIVSSASKPFKLTPKGSVKRMVTLNDYKEIVDALYQTSEDRPRASVLSVKSSHAEIKQFITVVLVELLDLPTIGEHDDIFSLGLDSLQTLRLSQEIFSSIDPTRHELGKFFEVSQLYARPSVSQISDHIFNILQENDGNVIAALTESNDDRGSRISNMVTKYTSNIRCESVVILTGSTGSLGTYLLSELLQDPHVAKIYCLNRSADAGSKQLKSLEERGLTSDLCSLRVEFIQADFNWEMLGLEAFKYGKMIQTVDTIIHNAWKVNFNHRLEAFESPHIQGVQRLVDLSVASARKAHLHFISSISTVEGSHDGHVSIPEVTFEDTNMVLEQGYAESKHVAERICATASKRLGIPTTIHRVGQIAGPNTGKGMWNKQEWIPSIIATSKTLKMIPDSLGPLPVQWLPIDSTARVIMDLVRSRRKTQSDPLCAAFHVINPRTTDWQSLLPAITNYFDVECVSLLAWTDELKKIAGPTAEDLEEKPALKILSTLEALASIDKPRSWIETTKTEAASENLRQMAAIDSLQMENWLKQWNF